MTALLRLLGFRRVAHFKWLQHGQRMPLGWRVAERTDALSHHGEYAILIVRYGWARR